MQIAVTLNIHSCDTTSRSSVIPWAHPAGLCKSHQPEQILWFLVPALPDQQVIFNLQHWLISMFHIWKKKCPFRNRNYEQKNPNKIPLQFGETSLHWGFGRECSSWITGLQGGLSRTGLAFSGVLSTASISLQQNSTLTWVFPKKPPFVRRLC